MEFHLELHRHLDGDKVTLIWDGLPSHRSRAMHVFIKSQRHWLVVERLRPYAYDLNPVERVWGNLMGTELTNLCPDTIGEAAEIVDQGLTRIGNETRLAFSFLRHCGLKPLSGPRDIARRSLFHSKFTWKLGFRHLEDMLAAYGSSQ